MKPERMDSQYIKNLPEGSGKRALDADEKKIITLKEELKALQARYSSDPDNQTMKKIKNLQEFIKRMEQDKKSIARADIIIQ